MALGLRLFRESTARDHQNLACTMAQMAHADALVEPARQFYRACFEPDAHYQRRPVLSTPLWAAGMMPMVLESAAHGERATREAFRALDGLDPVGWHIPGSDGAMPFHASHHMRPEDFSALQRRMTALARRGDPALVYAAPAAAMHSYDGGGRLRLGVVSEHLSNHSIGRMLAELLVALTRRGVELHCFVTGWAADDDYVRAILRDASASWTDFGRQSRPPLPEARAAIEAAQLDVLLFSDVGMDVWTYALSFSRLAPVQAVWWGHPSTTGQEETIDYFLSLDTEVPEAAEWYSEALVRMEHINAFASTVVDGQDLPREAFGLPAEGPVYLVFGRLFKIQPFFDEAYARILQADPAASIVFLAEKLTAEATAAFAARIGQRVPDDRVHFIMHYEWLDVLPHVTAVLDTHPYGGCVSTLDALAASMPVVSLPDRALRGQFTGEFLRLLGLAGELVATSVEDFAAKALALAHEPGLREAVVAKIEEGYPHKLSLHGTGIVEEWVGFFERAVRSAS